MSVKGRQVAAYPFGMYGSPTYVSWNNMKNRCSSKTEKAKKNYTDRGIGFTPSWNSFECFLKDMGQRPTGTTLERINNSLGYSKENCKWAYYSEQNRNRRTMSNTGEKHLSLYDGRYYVSVKPFNNKSFDSIEEARQYKNYLLNIRNNNLKLRRDSMIVDQITYTKRHNDGNYNYSEFTVTASLEEKDNALLCFEEIKKLVAFALEAKANERFQKEEEEKAAKEDEKEEEKPKKEKKAKKAVEEFKEVTNKETVDALKILNEIPKKEKFGIPLESPKKKKLAPAVIEPSELPPVEPEGFIAQPVGKNVVVYNSTIAEHKSILAGYLSKKYDTAWKTVAPAEEIKAFTSSLNGQPFLDDVGNILPVFLEEIHTFFGI